MGLVKRLKRTVRGDDEPTEYTYECHSCGSVFETEEIETDNVECPGCGEMNARQLPS